MYLKYFVIQIAILFAYNVLFYENKRQLKPAITNDSNLSLLIRQATKLEVQIGKRWNFFGRSKKLAKFRSDKRKSFIYFVTQFPYKIYTHVYRSVQSLPYSFKFTKYWWKHDMLS